uniref:RNase H type-1 domain-containing protein n=1 Tax=Nelumbo nucifera TaxID=4432 RepID=A0A822Y4M6_NELNU|nr:TPA_asm: hypothetical protein HUJ06_027654 [Nelumbo nucifera]
MFPLWQSQTLCCSSEEEAEAQAVYEGFLMAQSLSLHSIQLETECKREVDWLNSYP